MPAGSPGHDDAMRQFEASLSRRNFLAGTAGLSATALVLADLKLAAAQQAGPPPGINGGPPAGATGGPPPGVMGGPPPGAGGPPKH